MLHWLVTAVAVLAGGLALVRARRASRRLERLSESYWELRYEHGQLSARVARLEGSPSPPAEQGTAGGGGDGGKLAFVPLSSLRR